MELNLNKYEMWWENNIGNDKYYHNGTNIKAPSLTNFDSWMGDSESKDRISVRKLFLYFNNILDVGCGGCPEYYGLKNMYGNIDYTGMDITPKIVDFNNKRNIKCVQGSLNNIPFKDNEFDIVHTRHVVEHMSNIEKPLDEMIRVSSKKVFISFFISPNNESEHKINLDNKGTIGEVYHNSYSKKIIEKILSESTKVNKYYWVTLPSPSTILLIITIN